MVKVRLSAALVASLLALLVLRPVPASAEPIQGRMPWSILLCKFTDRQQELKPAQYFKDLFTTEGLGKGGLADFFAEQSRGRMTLEGSEVHGWYTIPQTFDEWSRSTAERPGCLKEAERQGFRLPPGHRLGFILNNDHGGFRPGVSNGAEDQNYFELDSTTWTVQQASFVMLRILEMQESRRMFAPDMWSYTRMSHPWDTMSGHNTYAAPSELFGKNAIGLAAPHLDELGWLPGWRVVTVGKDGETARTIQLAPLERPDLPGALMIRVPHLVDDPSRFLTVEFRKKTGRSSAIPRDAVLINEYRMFAGVLMDRDTGEPLTHVKTDAVEIRVDSVGENSATVTVTTKLPGACRFGYVPRDAVPGDTACVTPAARDQAALDNEEQPKRIDASGRCYWPYVYREILPEDITCVTATVKAQTMRDTEDTPNRLNTAKHAWGPNACQDEYVWRMSDDSDYVCVPMATRLQVLDDNAAAAGRWSDGPYGPTTCVQGYVWREAYAGDQVCVTPDRRDQAQADNRTAKERLRWRYGSQL
ncbi:hypothetical protein [Microtetraspora glauca]|uniref:Uncharacterized protein n=1 Tax=Microtetraspora glauca TaxID=1996 RepID=A0ABV3GU54_MICGL